MTIIKRIRFEPAVVSALIVAVLIFFGVPEEIAESVGQDSIKVIEAIAAALVVIGGIVTRQQVVPVAKIEAGGLPHDVEAP